MNPLETALAKLRIEQKAFMGDDGGGTLVHLNEAEILALIAAGETVEQMRAADGDGSAGR